MYKESKEDGERRSQKEMQRIDEWKETVYKTVRARDSSVSDTMTMFLVCIEFSR